MMASFLQKLRRAIGKGRESNENAAMANPDISVPLWPEGVPGQLGQGNEDNPHLEVFLAKEPTGAAVVVCPGGGYSVRAPHEAYPVAAWLNDLGITAAIVQYRVAPYKHPHPSNDGRRAIRLVRHHAAAWKVDPKRVGILGFSAGGHLASTVSTQFDAGTPDAKIEIDRQSCRPDLSILLYPVITLTAPSAHTGSRKNLVGDDVALIDALSNEKHATRDTPPTFIFHTWDDSGVPIENSLMYATALRKAGVSAELHLYEHGPHGVGMATGDHYRPILCTWPARCQDWLFRRKFANRESNDSTALKPVK